jgi:23S rRNA G2069 N7-methylase RlmK/C1962 C5-methylase RlmI
MAWEVEVVRNPSDDAKTAVRCDVGEVIKRRVRKAFQLRRDVFPDWFEKNDSDNVHTTTTYRLFNAEGDRLSGACCDVYTDRRTNVAYAVLSSSSAWTQKFQKEMIEALGSEANVDVVVWRVDEKMLKLETGAAEWVAEKRRGDDTEEEDEDDDDASSSAEEGEYATKIFDAKTGALTSLPNSEEPLVVVENGVSYEVDLALGHKTGFYVDQRENRLSMRTWAAGKNKVLDVCTYTGGFAINAAMAGASSVVGVDSSQPALDIAKRNAARNGVEANCTFVKAEAFKHLDSLLEEGYAGTYDVIVLDPPKLAPNAKSLTRALPKYVGLNKRAMRLLRPGGLLVTCSCSGAVTQNNLLPDVVLAAAQSAGTSATALGAPRGAGADQPLDPFYPEGNYLTVCVYRIG